MSGTEMLKLGAVAISVVATGLGGYLYVTREEPVMATPSVCPITGARSHDPEPEIVGKKVEASAEESAKSPAL